MSQPKDNKTVGHKRTPSFQLELPLRVDAGQSQRLRGHLEAARCLYNAILSEAMKRLRKMRSDPAWQAARAIPRQQRQERAAAFTALRRQYGFTEYALHDCAKTANCAWIAYHLDAVLAQTIASRAYRAANRVCLGLAKRVRFKSHGHGLDSIENKRNNTGLRFALGEGGKQGWLLWQDDRIPVIIDEKDEVIAHSLRHRIKYCRLVRRRASSERAKGADQDGNRFFVQLILEGKPHYKKKHTVGKGVVGIDLGPSTIAIVPQQGAARLLPLCEELAPNAKRRRRLQRKLDRQRRANNPDSFDERGRIKKLARKQRRHWKESHNARKTRRRLAIQERKLATHRTSLHGRLAHSIVALGNDIRLEKLSYKAWQKRYGKSVNRNAPGMFIARLGHLVASTDGICWELSTRATRLSQYCHACQTYTRKPLAQRWHCCACGLGPVQRDLYSAWLAAEIDPRTYTFPSIIQEHWTGLESDLRGVMERLAQEAKERRLPRSVGIARARASLPESLGLTPQESPLRFTRGRLKAWVAHQNLPSLKAAESQEATHPDHPQVSMSTVELVQVTLHLGQCPACGEIWGSLVQLSVLEEEGSPPEK